MDNNQNNTFFMDQETFTEFPFDSNQPVLSKQNSGKSMFPYDFFNDSDLKDPFGYEEKDFSFISDDIKPNKEGEQQGDKPVQEESMPSELEFDGFSENPFEANNNLRQIGDNNHIWSIKKTIRKPNQHRRKDYDKNICRYIVRKVIRCLASPEYKSQVGLYCMQFGSNYSQVKKHYEGQIERILGLRALRDEWVISEDDDDMRANQKRVFRRFSEWFLKHRYIRYVLNGKGSMKDKQEYIRYKNEIMLYYIKAPEKYNTNRRSKKGLRR